MPIVLPPAIRINDYLDYWSGEHPDKTAFIYGDHSWTYA